MNDDKEEYRYKKTKEVIPKYLSFIKVFVYIKDIVPLLPLNVNRETLHESNIIKAISKNLLRKAVEMLSKLAEKDEYKEDKDNKIDNNTKEVEINENGEVIDTDNEKLVINAANDDTPPQDSITTTTAVATK